MKIIADDKIPFLKGVLEPYADVVYLQGAKITPSDVKDADALITRTRTKCDTNLLKGTKVKLIVSATIGFDHIDMNYCDSNNIKWINAPGCNSSSVQQYMASALLYLANDKNLTLHDKTIGIVGVGNVGSKVAKLCEILGMRVLLNDPPRARAEGNKNFVSLEQICAEADIITFHVPLNMEGGDKTYHLVDKHFIDSLHKCPVLINTSRGEVVDSIVLKQALINKKILDAVLDVWENEPAIDMKLLDLAYIATPHIAGYSADGKANGTAMCVQTISRYFNLNLNHWYPETIPNPIKPIIEIDCYHKTELQILSEAVFATYNIMDDDIRLRNSPETFEKQRGDYPIRREFPAFSIKLKNNDIGSEIILKGLQFKVIET